MQFDAPCILCSILQYNLVTNSCSIYFNMFPITYMTMSRFNLIHYTLNNLYPINL